MILKIDTEMSKVVVIPLLSLFYLGNEKSLITALRSITSRFLLEETIDPLSSIELKSLKRGKKLIEFQNEFYIEHPYHFQLVFKEATTDKTWNRKWFYLWIRELVTVLKENKRTKLYLIINEFLKELDDKFAKSIFDLDLLLQQTNGLKEDMIHPFMHLYHYIDIDSDRMKRDMDWSLILRGHVESCSVVFNQILSSVKKEKILLEIFETVKIMEESNITIEEAVPVFKKEVNFIINNHTSYVFTNTINFKRWYASLRSFLRCCVSVPFHLKRMITKLNMVLYLALETDEILDTKSHELIYKTETNKYRFMGRKESEKLKKIHPFLRNGYKKQDSIQS